MRYWKLKESNRVIAVNKECEMSPRWMEITQEEFDKERNKHENRIS